MNAQTWQQPTVQQVKARFGCSWQSLRDNYAQSAETMLGIAMEARTSGKPYRGYTEAHAMACADDMAARAAECAARA